MTEDVLHRRLARSTAKVEALERLLEDKTRALFISNQDLVESNHFMTSVLQSMAGGLIVVDCDRRIKMVNRRLQGITGRDVAALVGTHVNQVLPAAGSYRPAEAGTAREEDTILLTVSGAIPIALTHSALPREEGHVYVVIDVRERKIAEAALRRAQQELVDTSRRAGMAEVATGVIHNVGNVVTAVNVTIQDLVETDEQSSLPSLHKVVALLEQQGDLPAFFATAKGAKVTGFLATLAQRLAGEREARKTSLLHAVEHLAHVGNVITAQQQHAKRTLVLEDIAATELVHQPLELYQARIQDLAVDVVTDVDGDLSLSTDRHQLIQILVNLVSNALDAMEPVDGPRRLDVQAHGQSDRVVFSVRDSGVGIAPENLDRVFSHGFTTRATGHGFGLHSAANAAVQLGGSLSCTSDGEGCGAEFVVDIPRRARAEAA